MITLDQIRTLDTKVQKAVEEIESLRDENSRLRQKLSAYEKKISELEVLIDSFKNDQGEIEEGIQKALTRLDILSSQTAAGTKAAEREEKSPESDKPAVSGTMNTTAAGILETQEEPEELQTEELDIF
ncbi:MAG: cell division protein ZapB [Spirochaetales bacterium]|nr:cell division protein ZapB [Spirochaetales bacterium]